MKLTIAGLTFAAIFLISGPVSAQDRPFTNADVLALSKAKLEDVLIVAKIKEAHRIDFKLDTDGILALQRDGVSSEVLKAMLERSAAARVAAPASPTGAPMPYPSMVPPGGAFNPPAAPGGSAPVGMMTASGPVDLQPESGTISTAGFAFVQNVFLNFSGIRAARRTTVRDSPIYIRSEVDPATSNSFTLVRLEVDEDDKVRSLQIRRGRGFTMTSAVMPEEEFVVRFTTEAAGPGIFRIRPERTLTPGEYGIVLTSNMIYAFGVD